MLQSKLSIRPYLNKKLKGTSDDTYMVYLRVTYKKKNTQIAFRRVLLTYERLYLNDADFEKQYENLKKTAENVIVPYMVFLRKYQKDDVSTLASSLPKLTLSIRDVADELNLWMHTKEFKKDDTDTEEKYFKTFDDLNAIIGKLNVFGRRYDLEITLFDYLNFKNIIKATEIPKISNAITDFLDDTFSENYDKYIVKFILEYTTFYVTDLH